MPTLAGMKGSRAPHPKVAAGSAAGALSILIVYAMGLAGVSVPAEVASAITVVLGGAAAYMKASA